MSTSQTEPEAPAKDGQLKETERVQSGPGGPGRGPMGGGMIGQKADTFWPSLKRLLARLHPERHKAYAVLVLTLLSVIATAIGPWILGRATDLIFAGLIGRDVLATGATQEQAIEALRARGEDNQADMLASMDLTDGVDFSAVADVLLVVLVVYVAASLLSFLGGYLLNDVVQGTVLRMRSEVEDKVHRLPLGYFDKQPRGELLSRVTNDIDNVSQTLQQTMSQMLTSVLTVFAVLTMMFWISPLLAAVALVSVPIAMFITGAVMKRSQGMFIQQWRRTGTLNAHIEETFSGHAIVKVFGRQHEAERVFAEQNDDLYQASYGAQFVSGLIMPIMMFVGNLNYVVIAVLGGLRVASGTMSLGDVQAFIQYSRQFTQPLTQVASMLNLLQSGVASAERVFELLDADEESDDATGRPAAAADARGEVRFDDVSFSYDPERPADRAPVARGRARPHGRDRRPDGRRQDDDGQPGDALLRPAVGPHPHRRRRHHLDPARRAARPDRDGAPGHLALRRHHPRQHRLRATRRQRGADPRGRAGPPSSTASSTRCPTATTRSSTRTARTCRPASASW